MHTGNALERGAFSVRISVLPAWRTTDDFTYGEQLALERVEAITRVATGQVPDVVYQQAADYFSADQIAALEWLAIVMNIWSRYPVRAWLLRRRPFSKGIKKVLRGSPGSGIKKER